MRITSKGQVTIPEDIRKKAGFLPETEVDFILDGNTVRLVKSGNSRRRGRDLVTRMRGKGSIRLTTDEIMKLTRDAG